MQTELTNLLPEDRMRTLRREYFLKLGTLAALALALLAAVHAALLVPSYLYLTDQVALERAHLAELDANIASSGEGEMNVRLSRLKEDADRLSALASSPSSAAVMRAVLAVPGSGISVTGLTFRAPAPDGRVTVTGMADRRESLRQYALALSGLPFAGDADVPLSSYAKESEIPFTITLIGPLTP